MSKSSAAADGRQANNGTFVVLRHARGFIDPDRGSTTGDYFLRFAFWPVALSSFIIVAASGQYPGEKINNGRGYL
ncbi:MAG: hypothetical protein GX887_03475 [Firmicutes bacterium]|nr:hypothetical protein [Bacillota bacterium]